MFRSDFLAYKPSYIETVGEDNHIYIYIPAVESNCHLKLHNHIGFNE